eukprot:531013-Rhodomonas_salina.1
MSFALFSSDKRIKVAGLTCTTKVEQKNAPNNSTPLYRAHLYHRTYVVLVAVVVLVCFLSVRSLAVNTSPILPHTRSLPKIPTATSSPNLLCQEARRGIPTGTLSRYKQSKWGHVRSLLGRVVLQDSVQRIRKWCLSYRAAASGTSLYCWAQIKATRVPGQEFLPG